MLNGKRGSLADLPLVAGLLLGFALIVVLGFKFMAELDDNLQSQPDDLVTSDAKTASTSLRNHYTGIIDNSFLFFTVFLAIATLVLAALVRIHPIFIPFFMIGLVIVIFLSGVVSNIYQEAAANGEISAQADQLTFITTIMNILPFIVGIIGILLMIVQYKLWRVELD